MVYKFFDKKSSCVRISGGAIKYETMLNQQLAEELLQVNCKKIWKSAIIF